MTSLKNRALAIVAVLGFAASSASAAVVWNLNPDGLNQPTGSNEQVFTSEGYQITARGYDIGAGGQVTPSELFFKNKEDDGAASEVGLGLATAFHNEVQTDNFIQLDLRSILAQGFTDGQIAVASVQEGEGFQLFGSNSEGVLGTALGAPYMGLAFDDKFVPIPNFGAFQFVSVIASTGDVLPSVFAATVTPIPEMSALM
ncbi:MAG: hypothetical protein H0T11_09245, partial [Chthoniobacterales bacterium]|nr:hypothetical protein [Chthoniobacterales bacterium]